MVNSFAGLLAVASSMLGGNAGFAWQMLLMLVTPYLTVSWLEQFISDVQKWKCIFKKRYICSQHTKSILLVCHQVSGRNNEWGSSILTLPML